VGRRQRIETVQRMMEERRDNASRALEHRRQLLDDVGGRLTELVGYRDEYASKMAESAPDLGVNLQDYWRFMGRLNSAIDEHRTRLEQHSLAVEQSLQRWQEAQREVAVIEKVIDRLRTREGQVQDRVEQRLLDEVARSRPLKFAAEEV